MKPVHGILVGAIALFAFPAFSAQSSGLYLGPEVASTRLEFNGSGFSKTHTMWGGFVGWQFNQVFGAELGLYRGSRISESTTVDGAAVNLDLKYRTVVMTVIGQHHFNDRYSVFARIGASTATQDSSGTVGSNSWIFTNAKKSSAVYGVGFGANIERAHIRLEYRRSEISFADSGALSLGVAWFISKRR